MRKIIGYIVALAAATLPLQYGLLNVKDSASPDRSGSNMSGTMLFVLFIAGIFIGYWLIDSANAQKKEGAAEH